MQTKQDAEGVGGAQAPPYEAQAGGAKTPPYEAQVGGAQAPPYGEIARAVGTPVYVYDAATIRTAYRQLDSAFGSVPHAVHYAMKANSSLAIVRLVRKLGSGADANSMGEVEVALRCGFEPRDIVFTGVGKRADELERAVALDLGAINVESPGELDRLARLEKMLNNDRKV